MKPKPIPSCEIFIFFYTEGHPEDPAHFSRARDLARISTIAELKMCIRPTQNPSQAQDDTLY